MRRCVNAQRYSEDDGQREAAIRALAYRKALHHIVEYGRFGHVRRAEVALNYIPEKPAVRCTERVVEAQFFADPLHLFFRPAPRPSFSRIAA